MKLRDVDALKAWLANAVSLICDAEPDDLAKYIVALLKKDKSDKELEDLCQKELQVFFKENTMEFLSKLFTTLKTESYIAESHQKLGKRTKREMSPIKMESNVLRNRPVVSKDDEKNEGFAKKFIRHDSGDSMRSKQSRNDNRDVRSRLEDANSREYKRLSSRDDNERRDRRRRSRSRDRSPIYRRRFGGSGRHHEELRSGRLRRRSSRGRSRSKDRTRSPFNDAGFRSAKYFAPIQKSGSPYEERNRYDQPLARKSPAHSRSSSIDLKDDTNYRITVPLDNLMGQSQGSLQNVQPSYQGYVTVPVQGSPTSIGFLGPPPTLTVPPPQISHPVQSSSSSLSIPSVVISAASHSRSSISDTSSPVQIPYGTSPGAAPQFAAPSKIFSTMPVILTQPPPVLHAHQQFAQFPHPGVNYQSQSIIIPKDSTNSSRHVIGFGASPAVFAFQEQSQSSVKSRLGLKVEMDSSQWLPTTSSLGCMLLINNIPPSFNNISSINQQFSKYGAINNIQVHYAGNPGSALVSFVTHESADAAYTSSEPVFNNRFIEVLWHNEDLQSSRIVIPEMRRSVKERLGACLPDVKVQGNSPSTAVVMSHSHNKETEKLSNISTNNLIAQVDTAKQQRTVLLMPSSKTAASNDAQSKSSSQVSKSFQFSKIKRNMPYNKLNLDLINEVKKRKCEWYEKNSLFLKEQLQKQKSLLEELIKPGLSAEEKLTIKKKLKELSLESEKLKLELDKTMKSAKPPTTSGNALFPTNATKLEIKKQILDAELDLISKAKDGTDTTELDKKINIMKSQAALMMKSHKKQAGPYKINKPYFKSFGKSNLRSTLSSTFYNIPQQSTRLLDRRPKQLLVTGFTSEKKNAVIAHLGRFGKMEKFVDGGNGSSIVVTYSTRKEAEKVAQLGCDFEGTKLKFAWPKSSENSTPVPGEAASSTPSVEIKIQDESSKKQRSVVEMEEVEDEEDDDDDDDSDTMIELVIEDDGGNDLNEQPYLDENDIDEDSLLQMS